jgi:hypothetical protein
LHGNFFGCPPPAGGGRRAPAAKLDMPLLAKVGAAIRKNLEDFITVTSGAKDKDRDSDKGKRR